MDGPRRRLAERRGAVVNGALARQRLSSPATSASTPARPRGDGDQLRIADRLGRSRRPVQFGRRSADRPGGVELCGAVEGGGGTLELANGSGTISGLGAVGTVSGAEGITFVGFGHDVIDAGASFTLSGTNTLAAYQQVANTARCWGLTLGSATDHVVLGADWVSPHHGGGGTLRLAGGNGIWTSKGKVLFRARPRRFVGFATSVIGAGGSWRSVAPILTSGKKWIAKAGSR